MTEAQDGVQWQRNGIAWTWPLEADSDWQPPRGDVLVGTRGDWWVVSEEGSSGTVAAKAFAATYAHVERQAHRRIGIIRALKAIVAERVQTLDGAASAEPGDWIATDPVGNRWPIPPKVFEQLYRPLTQEETAL